MLTFCIPLCSTAQVKLQTTAGLPVEDILPSHKIILDRSNCSNLTYYYNNGTGGKTYTRAWLASWLQQNNRHLLRRGFERGGAKGVLILSSSTKGSICHVDMLAHLASSNISPPLPPTLFCWPPSSMSRLTTQQHTHYVMSHTSLPVVLPL